MSEREPLTDLSVRLAEANQKVTVGARYIHYKQLSYRVLAIALREEDGEPCVIYQAEYGDKLIWSRPVKSWLEQINIDGERIARFTKLSKDI